MWRKIKSCILKLYGNLSIKICHDEKEGLSMNNCIEMKLVRSKMHNQQYLAIWDYNFHWQCKLDYTSL